MSGAAWHNVSKKDPCPVCHKPDWCTVSNDGMMCVCRRVPSPHPAKSGMGWIHILVERPPSAWTPPRRPSRPRPPQLFDAERTMAGFRDEFCNPPGGGDIFDSIDEIGADLNLAGGFVDLLEVGRSAFHGAWAFPMRDGDGKTVGIRLRAFGGSKKWSVAGSQDGLFYDTDLQPRETVYNGLRGREIVVVEGATDTIAGYALGLPCVGRSSCGTGADHLRRLCSRLNVNRVTIVSDNDDYKARADGMPWRPGVDGAQRLARSLGRTFRIVVPPKKDLRDWYSDGLEPETFWWVADLHKWRIK